MCHDQRFRPLFCAFVFLVALPAMGRAQFVTQPPIERDPAKELACSPQAPLILPEMMLRIAGAPQEHKTLYGVGDIIIIDSGVSSGLQPGQQYYARRVVPDRFTEPLKGYRPISVHTAGWVQIQDVQPSTATAKVVYACDGLMQGDYLEPFSLPAVPGNGPSAQPDFASPAHVILGDDRRQMGSVGQYMALDRGSDHGLQPGQRLTIFRPTLAGAGPAWLIGTGTALTIGTATSVFRIDTAEDVVWVGDLIAVQK
jgi:hypothetical protein